MPLPLWEPSCAGSVPFSPSGDSEQVSLPGCCLGTLPSPLTTLLCAGDRSWQGSGRPMVTALGSKGL